MGLKEQSSTDEPMFEVEEKGDLTPDWENGGVYLGEHNREQIYENLDARQNAKCPFMAPIAESAGLFLV